jgi:serine protease Do
VTNLHVIEGATSVAVKLASGDVHDQVRVRAFDQRKDLAVIQVSGFNLPRVEFGDSDAVQPGQPVVLIGSPLRVLEGSVSTGVVSGVRTLEDAGFRVIQTDAAANPGNRSRRVASLREAAGCEHLHREQSHRDYAPDAYTDRRLGNGTPAGRQV